MIDSNKEVVSIDLNVKLLTPAWTGDANEKCKRIHETGIIGSLRWWFEVVARGLGGSACSLDNHECSFDEQKYRSIMKNSLDKMRALSKAGLCPASQVFGATGWKKRFQLDADSNELKEIMEESRFLPSTRPHNGNPGGWYILPGMISVRDKRKDKHGTSKLSIRWSDKDELNKNLLLAVFRLMENWTGVGAKTTNGYGVFKVENEPQVNLPGWNPFLDSQNTIENKNGILPELKDFFFSVIRFKPYDNWWKNFKEIQACLSKTVNIEGATINISRRNPLTSDDAHKWLEHQCFPSSYIIRNWLRYSWSHHLGQGTESFIFGTAANDVCPQCYERLFSKKSHCGVILTKEKILSKVRSKIGLSHAYQQSGNANDIWEFRLWGYLPGQGKLEHLKLKLKKNAGTGKGEDFQREEFLENLQEAVLENGALWSSADGFKAVGRCQGVVWREFNSSRDTVGLSSDPWEFFKSLVKGEGLCC